MAVKIRLRRPGKNPNKKVHFRIAVLDHHKARDARVIEELGFYNPAQDLFKINRERFDYWVKNGAQVCATLKNLIKKLDKKTAIT